MTVYYRGPIDALKTMPINVINGIKVFRPNLEETEGIAATRELQDPLPDGVSVLTHEEAQELVQTPAYSPPDEE
tara:strand:- start:592 stop:813 length:222 start_codon:yes stop_codon:yes gene_type:complete